MSLRPWSGTWCVHALECIHKSYTLTQSSAQSQSCNTAADWPLDEATPEQSQRKSNLKVALQECRPKNVIIDIMTVCWTLTEVLIWPLNENCKLHFFGVIFHESPTQMFRARISQPADASFLWIGQWRQRLLTSLSGVILFFPVSQLLKAVGPRGFTNK